MLHRRRKYCFVYISLYLYCCFTFCRDPLFMFVVIMLMSVHKDLFLSCICSKIAWVWQIKGKLYFLRKPPWSWCSTAHKITYIILVCIEKNFLNTYTKYSWNGSDQGKIYVWGMNCYTRLSNNCPSCILSKIKNIIPTPRQYGKLNKLISTLV